MRLGYSNSNYGEFAIIKMCYTYIMADNSSELEKSFDHNKGEVADKIAVIGELEHIRRHALRSAVSLANNEDDAWLFYLVLAKQAKEMRRAFQKNNLPEISDPDWCLCKSASCLRQMAYEIDLDKDQLKEFDDLVDNIWGHALDMDLSDCIACAEDKGK